MSMRIYSAGLVLLLAGCGGGEEAVPDAPVVANVEEQVRVAKADDDRVLCQPPGTEGFAPNCSIERTATPDGTLLTLRLPDGGFHRLRVTTDGRGVIAADGSLEAAVSIVADGLIEIAIGDTRYRLPATVAAR